MAALVGIARDKAGLIDDLDKGHYFYNPAAPE